MWPKLKVHHSYLGSDQSYFPYPTRQGYIPVEHHNVGLLVVMALVLPNNALRQYPLYFESVLYSDNWLCRLDWVTVVDLNYACFYPLGHGPNPPPFAYIEYYFEHSIQKLTHPQLPLYLLRTARNH